VGVWPRELHTRHRPSYCRGPTPPQPPVPSARPRLCVSTVYLEAREVAKCIAAIDQATLSTRFMVSDHAERHGWRPAPALERLLAR